MTNPAVIAESLWKARVEKRARSPILAAEPTLTIDEAYRISRMNFERRLKETGTRSVGRKIGLTSRAVQAQLKVNEPDFGFLTADMDLSASRVIPAGALIQGRVEGEVAFRLGRDLPSVGTSREEVERATDSVMACIEIADCRIENWKIQIQDTVADNAAGAYFVLGAEKRKLSDVDLRAAGMALWLNGEVESTGAGAACLDHPVNAVVWLARKMAQLGDPLKAGDIILSGAYGPLVPIKAGDRCEVAIRGLGKVEVSYAR